MPPKRNARSNKSNRISSPRLPVTDTLLVDSLPPSPVIAKTDCEWDIGELEFTSSSDKRDPPAPFLEIAAPEAPQPFSYGYAYTAPSPPSSPIRISASGLAQSSPRSSRPSSASTHKRFPAPLPFTRLVGGTSSARPVVDLGTAGRERDRKRRLDPASAPVLVDSHQGRGEVIWTKWDYVRDSSDDTKEKRLLFVGYTSAFQIWDCTNLESLQEILNVDAAHKSQGDSIGWSGCVLRAAVMPESPRKAAKDPFRDDKPLIGILTDGVGDDDAEGCCVFVLYSLSRCEVVRRARVGERAVEFQVNEQFVVISTVDPPTLLILSSTTLDTLSTVSSSSFLPYIAPPPPQPSDSTNEGAGALLSLETLSNAFTSNFQHYYQPQHRQHSHYLSSNAHHLSDSSTGEAMYNNNSYQDKSVSSHTHAHALVVEEEEMERRRKDDHEQAMKRGRTPTPSPDASRNANTLSSTSTLPRPIFALSHRLLAFASPVPTHSHSPRSTSPVPAIGTAAGSGAGAGAGAGSGLGLPTTQAELLKAGGTVLSGMRTLGGMALSAAKSRVGARDTSVARFFSRSAPAEGAGEMDEGEGSGAGSGAGERTGERRERRCSSTSSGVSASPAPAKYYHPQPLQGGSWVTVVDLFPLLSKHTVREPEKVAEFLGSRDKHVSGLGFSSDGCGVVVVPRDGQVALVFQLRFGGAVFGGGVEADRQGKGQGQKRKGRSVVPPWHVYELRRGWTPAVVEAVECARDGRWVAVATRKRTVHLFAVNPYGGKPDHKSHLEGRVRNVDEVQHMPTELNPLLRLRVTKQPTGAHAPLAITFISPSHSTFPSLLAPHTQANTIGSSPPLSISSESSSPTRHTHTHSHTGTVLPSSSSGRPAANFQDLLLFDPVEGTLSLRRCVLELKARDRVMGMGMGMGMGALGGTSISLPGMGAAGRLSASSPGGRSRLTEMMDAAGPVEMVAKESVVATWNLRVRGGEGVVRVPLGGGGGERSMRGEWLSQAELSSFSRSVKLLPRSIYLSHQFSFYTLGEDYHALIRRYQLDISGAKIDVRKEVQASAYPAGSGESFVEGFSMPRDIRNRTLSSSFDEPLASALAGGLEYRHSPGILPMLPNGMPRTQSFRTSIPIRTMTGLGDGVSEGLGRIRREINRVRSPRLLPRPDSSMSASVPLEFDEEDEDFVGRDMLDVPDGDGTSGSRGTSRGGAESGASPTVSTPATSAHALDDDDDGEGGGGGGGGVLPKMDDEPEAWSAWSAEDRAAVEEAERFDDISVVGFLDEEQEQEVERRKQLGEKRGEVLPEMSSIKRKSRGRRRV